MDPKLDRSKFRRHRDLHRKCITSPVRFEGKIFPVHVLRIFQIEREIASLNQGDMPVSAYNSRLKGLWDELCSYNEMTPCECGTKKKIEENEQRSKLMRFIMGRYESYLVFRGHILLM